MGMRGKHAVVTHARPTDELVITATAIMLYRRMRRLECHCECPDDGDIETMCANCQELWRLNTELGNCFGLPAWMTVYEDPQWSLSRSSKSAIDRFHALEAAAASKATKGQKFKFKWQK
jgi:hypothetical protein